MMHRDSRPVCAWALLLVASLAIGCARAPVIRVEPASAVPHANVTYGSFGEAADDFAPAAARSLASSPEEHAYAAALEQFVTGDLANCAKTLASLGQATSPSLRARARDLHEAVLMQLGAYRELGRVSSDPDAAAVARAFGEAPEQQLNFAADDAVVPVTFSNAGSPMVDVTIQGYSAKLWIDCGANFSVLSSDVAERAGVHPVAGINATATVGTSGPGKQINAQLTLVNPFQVGALRGGHIPFVILSEKDLSLQILFLTFLKVEGILGWNLLRQVHLTVNYPQAFVRIGPSRKTTRDRNLFWYGMPVAVATTVDGKNFYLGIDTGARRSYLTEHGARKLRGSLDLSNVSSVSDVSFVLSGSAVYFSKMDIKSMPRASRGTDGVLGNDVLSRGTLDIDSLEGRVDFAAP
ncbi:MAG: retroviral-like aspartic protease family protein [Polyangiaceae bacterium]|nr:retroviral-like aspartic protease family protein [Polyangiaceae bacterium]